jgi:DNA-binding transcriptional LysR family regulator
LVRLFTAVVDAGSFRGAADVLAISQPAVSRGVQELERQVGTALIDRTARPLALTDAGRVLHEHAMEIFAIERSAEVALGELDDVARGQLAIGASTTIGIYLLPELLGVFQRKSPGVGLFLDIGNTALIVDHLRTTPLDFVFVEGPVAPSTDLLVEPWREDVLVPIAAPGHPLAARGPIPVADLLAAPFIMREAGSGTREVVDAAMRGFNVAPPVAMELGSTEAIKQAVAAGLGISIVSTAAIRQELALGGLIVLDVPGLRIRRILTRIRMAQRPQSRAARAFLALSSTER